MRADTRWMVSISEGEAFAAYVDAHPTLSVACTIRRSIRGTDATNYRSISRVIFKDAEKPQYLIFLPCFLSETKLTQKNIDAIL